MTHPDGASESETDHERATGDEHGGRERASDNQPYFDWPESEGPAREVWYGLVSHPDEPIAFWYRYTLVSTVDGDGAEERPSEARVWAALTDAREDGTSSFRSARFDPADVALESAPFRYAVGDAVELRDDGAAGVIRDDGAGSTDADGVTTSADGVGTTGSTDADGPTSWELSYEPDELTFTPIRDENLMYEAADSMGTGVHWSANQSIAVDGEVTVDGTTVSFEDAPGHQGHTAGPEAPSDWTWVHCNAFDADVSMEALSMADRLIPVCLRLPEETHLLNTQAQVFGDAVETVHNEPGSWEFRGETDEVAFTARVEAGDDWRTVSYLTPDGSLRYNAHDSLATVELTVEGASTRTYRSEAGRAEWVQDEPPLPGSYPPFDD